MTSWAADSYTWFDAEGAAAESKRVRNQFIDREPLYHNSGGRYNESMILA